MIFRAFYVVCSECGHKNRPHKSPREGVRLALTGDLPPCNGKGCGKKLRPRLSDRPLVRQVRAELAADGVTPKQKNQNTKTHRR